MNLLGMMEAVHEAQREVDWRLEQSNICTTMVDWRLIDDIYPFYSKIIHDCDVGFCTVIGTLDDGYHVRDIYHGIEFFHTYIDIKLNKSNPELLEKFKDSIDKFTMSELVQAEMGL